MKILITGAAGFVASHLIEYLNRFHSNYQIIGIDNFSYGYKERLLDLNLRMIEGDIERIDEFNIKEKIDAVIHTAAIAPLPDNEINPIKSYEQNVVNTIRMADFAAKLGCNKFIFLSSGAIYENDQSFPSKERDHVNTSLIYPTTKMCAEHALRSYSKTYGISSYALRLFNMYGPRQDFFRKQPPLIGYLLKSIFNNEIPKLYSDGNQSRDYVYIDDLAKIVIELLSNKYSDKTLTTINIGSGVSTSVNQIIDYLSLIHDSEIKVIRNPSTLFWQKYPSLFERENPLKKSLIEKEVNKFSLSDNSKLKELTGKLCDKPMIDGLRECYDYAKIYFNKCS